MVPRSSWRSAVHTSNVDSQVTSSFNFKLSPEYKGGRQPSEPLWFLRHCVVLAGKEESVCMHVVPF